MWQTYRHRYQRAPGKWVYVPTESCVRLGEQIIERVAKNYTPHDIFYHIGRRGGHVEALRLHDQSTFFSRFDLEDFFGNVIRSKITRSLRDIGFGSRLAFDWAISSVVVQGSRKVLPQGFVQSPLLATLALEHSALGLELERVSRSLLKVSVYMDDIIVSGGSKAAVLDASATLVEAAIKAGFPLAASKKALGEREIQAFNCNLRSGHVAITDERMAGFAHQWFEGSPNSKSAIDRYVGTINPTDLERLSRLTNALV